MSSSKQTRLSTDGVSSYGAVVDLENGETDPLNTTSETANDDDDDDDDNMSVASLADLVPDIVQEYAATGEVMDVREFRGDAKIPSQIFNLIKNLVGCGVLALPSGVAAFASAPSATIPAAFYTILMAVIFGYYFLLIGKTCKLASAATYREVWEKTMGNKMSAAVATVNMLKPALANLAYSMILADTFKSLFEAIGFYFTRTSVLLFITVVALLPLCLLKNLKVLAPFSILGSLGMILTAFAMGVRYFDGTYDPDRSGKFLQELPDRFHPSFGTTGAQGAWSPQVMVLVCMLFEAYVAHYNAPRFIIELENNTVARFGKVVSWAFGASCAIYVMMTTFGFLTFGTASDGYILNNYATNDPLASICRVAIAFAILFTYPVVFMGFRDGVFDLLPIPSARETSHLLNVMTVSLLTILTFVAVFFDNLGVLNAVGGGTIATAIVFVFPSLFYRKAIHDHYKGTPPQSIRLEVMLVMILMWIGIAMGAVGVYMAIADLQRTHHGDATLEDGTASAGEPADASS